MFTIGEKLARQRDELIEKWLKERPGPEQAMAYHILDREGGPPLSAQLLSNPTAYKKMKAKLTKEFKQMLVTGKV